jgi:hypothetical protein
MLDVETLPVVDTVETVGEAAVTNIEHDADDDDHATSLPVTAPAAVATPSHSHKISTLEIAATNAGTTRTLYKNEGVHITTRFARFGQKTYAVPHLTQIHTGKIKADFGPKALINAALGGAIGLLLGLLLDLTMSTTLTAWLLLIGVAFGLTLAYLTRNKPHFFLRIKMSSGEADTIKSSDETYIFNLANHLLKAMVEGQSERS